MSNYYYLDLTLEFINPTVLEVSPVFLKKNITEAINKVFGEVTAAVTIDLLKYNQQSNRAIIRVPKSHYIKIRSSLALASKYEGEPCIYKIHKATSLLLALQAESRSYSH